VSLLVQAPSEVVVFDRRVGMVRVVVAGVVDMGCLLI
jgi:hypothetical protein